MIKLSIIVPALNEEDKIIRSILEAIRAAEIVGISYEIIAIDDTYNFIAAQKGLLKTTKD